jgi:uncharacterized protein YlxW (UPF0749 family)
LGYAQDSINAKISDIKTGMISVNSLIQSGPNDPKFRELVSIHVTQLQALFVQVSNEVDAVFESAATGGEATASLQSQITNLSAQVITLTGEKSSLQSQVSGLESQVSNLQEQLDSTGAAALQEQVNTLTSQLGTANSTISTLQGQITTVTNEKNSAVGERNALQSQVSGLQSQISSLQAQLNSGGGGGDAALNAYLSRLEYFSADDGLNYYSILVNRPTVTPDLLQRIYSNAVCLVIIGQWPSNLETGDFKTSTSFFSKLQNLFYFDLQPGANAEITYAITAYCQTLKTYHVQLAENSYFADGICFNDHMACISGHGKGVSHMKCPVPPKVVVGFSDPSIYAPIQEWCNENGVLYYP